MYEIKIIPIIVCVFVSMVFGMAWYSPKVVGDRWMRLNNLNPDNMGKGMATGMILSAIEAFIFSMALECIISWVVPVSLWDGLKIGAMVGLGIGATSIACNEIWERRSWELYLINASFVVIRAILFSGVITYLR